MILCNKRLCIKIDVWIKGFTARLTVSHCSFHGEVSFLLPFFLSFLLNFNLFYFLLGGIRRHDVKDTNNNIIIDWSSHHPIISLWHHQPDAKPSTRESFGGGIFISKPKHQLPTSILLIPFCYRPFLSRGTPQTILHSLPTFTVPPHSMATSGLSTSLVFVFPPMFHA